MKIGQKIAELRYKKKITQKDLAQVLNVSQGVVALWESGKRLPSLECFVDIIDFFAVDADSMLSEDRKINIINDVSKNNPEYIEFGEAYKELNKDNRDILIGRAKEHAKQLLKEQRLEEKRKVLPVDEAM